jgi:hypothetical protein
MPTLRHRAGGDRVRTGPCSAAAGLPRRCRCLFERQTHDPLRVEGRGPWPLPLVGRGNLPRGVSSAVSLRVLETALSSHVGTHVGATGAKLEAKITAGGKEIASREDRTEYVSKKIELLHRNILRYKSLFERLAELAEGPTFLLLDDLYHIQLVDQAHVLDYFHRIAKGSNLWIKVGTIRHRSRWYVYGKPPYGMKLGDDAEEIDLDVTLEKYDLTKRFTASHFGTVRTHP